MDVKVRALVEMQNRLMNVMYWGHSRVTAKRRKMMGMYNERIWHQMLLIGRKIVLVGEVCASHLTITMQK